MALLSALGFGISTIAFIYIIITLIQTLIFGISVPGYVTTLCAVLFLGGIIELSIGILGEYISRIYMESKHRPIYLVKDTNINNDNSSASTSDEKADNKAETTETNKKSKKAQQITNAVEKAVADNKDEDEPEKVEYDLSYFE